MPRALHPRMDQLKMTRRQVAAVPVLGTPDLSRERVLAAAGIVNEAILAQFPKSEERQRLPIATALARQLDIPRPTLVASRLRAFYEHGRQARATRGKSDPDEGAGEAVIIRKDGGQQQEL